MRRNSTCYTSERCGRRNLPQLSLRGLIMYLKTEGLVLRETEYLDAYKLLTVLTKDHGLLTFRARGVRSKSSRLKSGCQLLAYSEFTVFESHGKYRIYEAVLSLQNQSLLRFGSVFPFHYRFWQLHLLGPHRLCCLG